MKQEATVKKESIELIKNIYISIPKMLNTDTHYKKQNFEYIYENIKNTNKQFSDIFFKPEQRNIIYIDKNIKMNKLIDKSDLEILKKYYFEKLSLIYPLSEESYKKFHSKMLSNKREIVFNTFGNINLYNFIIFLLQNKNWLTNTITKYDLNKNIFMIKLYLQGKPKYIIVDEYIPVINEDNTGNPLPAFINPNKDTCWLLIIEKAIAKLHRSYGNTLRLLSSEIANVLSEAPLITFIHNLNKSKKLWEYFYYAGKKNWIIFSEFASLSFETYNTESFISFFLINAFKIKKNKYVEITIPEVINEKEFEQIKKKFLDLSEINSEDFSNERYFPEIKRNSNKIIYMSFNAFYKSFYKTCILKYEPNFTYNYQKFSISSSFNLAKLKIHSPTKCYLTLHLKEPRYYIRMNNYEVPIVQLIVAKLKKEVINTNEEYINMSISNSESSILNIKQCLNLDYISSSYGKQEKHTLELDLEPGIYYILFKIYSNDSPNDSPNVVLSTYSSSVLQFVDVNNYSKSDYNLIEDKECQRDAFVSLFNSYIEKKGNIQHIEKDENLTYSHSVYDPSFGFSLLKFDNKTKDKIMNLNLVYEATGMSIISHSIERNKKSSQKIETLSTWSRFSNRAQNLDMTVLPKEKEIIIFEWSKNLNEININVKPSFIIEKTSGYLADQKDYLNNTPKIHINDDIFYHELAYFSGVYLVIINQSNNEYMCRVEFEKIDNLVIVYPFNCSEVYELTIKLERQSKTHIHLKTIKDKVYSYKVNFNLINI
jgi:hypothetical protein